MAGGSGRPTSLELMRNTGRAYPSRQRVYAHYDTTSGVYVLCVCATPSVGNRRLFDHKTTAALQWLREPATSREHMVHSSYGKHRRYCHLAYALACKGVQRPFRRMIACPTSSCSVNGGYRCTAHELRCVWPSDLAAGTRAKNGMSKERGRDLVKALLHDRFPFRPRLIHPGWPQSTVHHGGSSQLVTQR